MRVKSEDTQFPENEVVERREAALKRMLATPPTPHKLTPKRRPAPKKMPKPSDG
jgi:hypothetical protein